MFTNVAILYTLAGVLTCTYTSIKLAQRLREENIEWTQYAPTREDKLLTFQVFAIALVLPWLFWSIISYIEWKIHQEETWA